MTDGHKDRRHIERRTQRKTAYRQTDTKTGGKQTDGHKDRLHIDRRTQRQTDTKTDGTQTVGLNDQTVTKTGGTQTDGHTDKKKGTKTDRNRYRTRKLFEKENSTVETETGARARMRERPCVAVSNLFTAKNSAII